MTTISSSISHLKILLNNLETRLTHTCRFIEDIRKQSCCTDTNSALIKLERTINMEVKKNLSTFSDNIRLAEFEGREEFKYNDIDSAIYADIRIKNILGLLSCIHHHILLEKEYTSLVHSLQVLMHQNGQFLNNIQDSGVPGVQAILPICNMAGAQSCNVSTGMDIIAIMLPYPDACRIQAWPLVSHEMVHGFFRHKYSGDPRRNYKNEFIADLYAVLFMGPAYLFSFFNEVGRIPGRARSRHHGKDSITHPFIEKRIPLCLDVLERILGFPHEFILHISSYVKGIWYYKDPDTDEAKLAEQHKIYLELLGSYTADEALMRRFKAEGMTHERYKALKRLDDISSKDMKGVMGAQDLLNSYFKEIWETDTYSGGEDPNEKVQALLYQEGIRRGLFKDP